MLNWQKRSGGGSLLKSVGVNGTKAYGHFGGISVFKDYVYISVTGRTLVVSLTDLLNAEDKATINVLADLYQDTGSSYNNVIDGVLYIGKYTEDNKAEKEIQVFKDKDSKGKEYYAHCNAYYLDENGLFGFKDGKIVPKKGGKKSDYTITQDFAIATDLKVQGMARMSDGRFVFSASATPITNSNIHVYKDLTARAPDAAYQLNGCDIPVYFCTEKDRYAKYKVPVLSEEISLSPDGSIYIVFESAAGVYRKYNKNPVDCCMKWDINKMK